ncbi:glycosyltransferase [Shewanella sp. SP2S2-4]|uniref:glycosyltransferase family 2 protein n=1 Tax=Shewanella sp. SP2S2-4 TaxID=3063539 RepID=UPI002891ECA8|nr:glycosyltransferase [Shewanella sp. SP2S2-4]MDT3275661.1 glycosyltransferase [Shewanella sp. SP2S2-4]
MLSDVRIQVIILTYKQRYDLLSRVILSLINESLINDILVVDNGCDYDLINEVYISNLPSSVRVLKINNPVGTSKAFVQAFDMANKHSTHILILDDDNVLEGSLDSVKQFLDEKSIINLLRSEREPYSSSYMLGKNIKFLNNSFYGFSLFNYISNFFYKKMIFFHTRATSTSVDFVESDMLPFGGTIFPISLLNNISLNKNFILYHDDIDFFYRSKGIGYKLRITSLCKTVDIDNSWHNKNMNLLDSLRLSPENVYYAIRNKVFFEYRHSSFKIYFYLNMFIWRFIFFVKNIKKAGSFEYSLLNKAISDGLQGKLGVFEK